MEGIRFFKDASEGRVRSGRGWSRKDFPDGFNGMAVLYENTVPGQPCVECRCAVYDGPGDGPYAGGSVHFNYLSEKCKRISEAEARELFPVLLRELDNCE